MASVPAQEGDPGGVVAISWGRTCMSADGVKPAGSRLFLKKSIAQIQKEAAKSELKRTLGPMNLMSLGIGAIIGAGIFVLTGQVASAHAGPAIMFSFVIAGIALSLIHI